MPCPFPWRSRISRYVAILGDYGSIAIEDGIRQTYEVFRSLLAKGLVSADVL